MAILRSALRQYVPIVVRQFIRHHLRQLNDFKDGLHFQKSQSTWQSSQPVRLIWPIMRGEFYDNKVINISHAVNKLNQNLIQSHHYWSFWHRVGFPSKARGFMMGRNLVDGKLVAQTGGGLCQIASMAYYLALMSGLTIIERHSHSLDIYEEHLRIAPLGADAAVVWGVKDLRLLNPYPFAVSFHFKVQDGALVGEVHAEQALTPRKVEFIRQPLAKPFIKVQTVIDQRLHSTTLYEQKQGLNIR